MQLVLRCKLDLDALLKTARLVPTIMENSPKLVIDGGVVEFSTPNEVVEWIREALKNEQR